MEGTTWDIDVEKVWIKFIWLRIGAVAGFCEHGNEPTIP
jgi:hypothetical protein